jgi:hypothetical protein
VRFMFMFILSLHISFYLQFSWLNFLVSVYDSLRKVCFAGVAATCLVVGQSAYSWYGLP